MKGRKNMLFKSHFGEYINSDHVIMVKTETVNDTYNLRIYTKTTDSLSTYKTARDMMEAYVKIMRPLSANDNWLATHGYAFKESVVEGFIVADNMVTVIMQDRRVDIPCLGISASQIEANFIGCARGAVVET